MPKYPKVHLFNVAPCIPEQVSFLETLARNMWWCWNTEAIELFRRIDPKLWRSCGHNPLVFLSQVPQRRLESLAQEESFVRHLQEVRQTFEATVPTLPGNAGPEVQTDCIAYFSLEYGIHESIRLYSGGLGVLAGDHLKAASDLELPLAAVGLLYRQGYFRQYLNKDGWQQEHYPDNEIHHLPLHPVYGEDGHQLTVELPLPEGVVHSTVWRLDIGRVPLYLLDTNTPENPPEFRKITAQLYGGDRKARLRQELILGIAGYRALLAVGLRPKVCHINEGHAAFLSIARIHHLMTELGLALPAATEIVRRTNVFTTHTPVPAGNETFSVDLVRPYLDTLEKAYNIPTNSLLAWSQPGDGTAGHEFSMTVLGLRMSLYSNGVSKLHGEVARRMWSHLWPDKPEDEIPIRHVTNGIHVSSWLSPDNAALYRRYLGPDWEHHPASSDTVHNIMQIPDEELWRSHELGRSRLIRTAREHLERQWRVRNATRAEIAQAKSVLDHDALTIGFARRFATYKRATLLLRDPERFERLLTDEDRPIQFIFAGKAHPADDHGKDLIRRIIQFSQRTGARRRIVFLENYNINVARTLVQGVDVWLNTPRRPEEASGTSGMKAAVNGGLHLSILDGWWAEGFEGENGWAIGDTTEYDDHEYQDTVEAQALYNIIENEVIPKFYDRQLGDLPVAWIRMMRNSIRVGLRQFTSHRMVSEYSSRFYTPAIENYRQLVEDGATRAKEVVNRRDHLDTHWKHVHVDAPESQAEPQLRHVGDTFLVSSAVHLGELKPEDVVVQVYYGPVSPQNRIIRSHVETMTLTETESDGRFRYEHTIECRETGRYGFTTRVVPSGRDWQDLMPGFVTWADVQ